MHLQRGSCFSVVVCTPKKIALIQDPAPFHISAVSALMREFVVVRYGTITFGLHGQLSDDMMLIAALLLRWKEITYIPQQLKLYTTGGAGKMHASRGSMIFAMMFLMSPASVQKALSPHPCPVSCAIENNLSLIRSESDLEYYRIHPQHEIYIYIYIVCSFSVKLTAPFFFRHCASSQLRVNLQ